MDVAALGSEPVGYLISNLRCDRKSREVGASVRIYLVPVLERSGAAACNSETALPVEAMHPLFQVTALATLKPCIPRSDFGFSIHDSPISLHIIARLDTVCKRFYLRPR